MVFRKPNSELEMKNPTPSVKHVGGSQMVWGCMSAVDVGKLHFIDGIMDKLWALYHCPQVIRTPAQSPDLNAIENVWDHLNNRILKFKISSKNELREKLMSEWDKIEGNVCANLVKSMPKRLKS
ncbi:hypothetical protein AVEN_164188-1 [Araneus ventricosus]|uniref:Tc1-like transposase DDE domain-containing protein n=1 Tax=Araneus ventricosus TaxID=182803 RepID=A0A4Y2KC48_ARAVE|nr:hypothetical protein AVEN_164188-1 [Araneus ventricosus]